LSEALCTVIIESLYLNAAKTGSASEFNIF